jgi:oligopeptide/dipeptide ABC transporter ATP-binding protein
VYPGEVVAVVGESGSGKSVSMKAVMGLLPENAEVQAGALEYDGRDVLAMGAAERRALCGGEIAMVFQDPMTALDPLRTVGFHLLEVLKRHRGLKGAAARAEALRVLADVGIPSPEQRMGQYPHEFSGGMRQRVLIAMALCCEPRLIIADEPTTALDVTIQAQILDLLRRLSAERGMSVVLITHDLGVVANLCSRVSVMYGGRIMEHAAIDDIFYRPRHPYTRALLGAVPDPRRTVRERLVSIPGAAPSLVEPPQGCPFYERCNYACERCRAADVPRHEYEHEQDTRCVWTADELDRQGAGHPSEVEREGRA